MVAISDLVIAIDLSEDGPRVIALVGARDHVLKSRSFLYHVAWVKHFREVPSPRKSSYMKRFPRRFLRVRRYLDIVRIVRSVEALLSAISMHRPRLILVDNKLLQYVQTDVATVIPENRVVYRHHRALIMLADNIANYFRVLLKSDPRRFLEELRKFEK